MSRYIVTIIGRPNVGKSTLFNRIVGKREAIVHDMPGVTRDRNYADAEWAGKLFTLVDTGGYFPSSSEIIEQAMREQAQVAMDEADAILFLVDATEGATPLDREIAGILRKTNKRLFLVVNKVDSDKREPELGQFFELGLGEPIPVSAALGRKIGDFLDLVTEAAPRDGRAEKDERLKLAIIGKPNVGKSSLVNALVGAARSIVAESPGTTRDSIDTVLKYHGEEIVLVDTAGLRRRSRIKETIEFFSTIRTIKSIERCNVAVVLADGVQGIDKQDLRIIDSVAERKRPMILAVNKWDLVDKDEKTAQHFERVVKAKLRRYDYVPIVFISAKTKQRTATVIEIAKDIHTEAGKRITTKKLNDVLHREMKHTPPRSSSGKEIKIKYATQVKKNPPAFAFFVNDPELIQEPYRRYLENMIRRHFGFSGVPITVYFRKRTQ